MVPEEFVNRIRAQNYIDTEALLSSLDQPSPVSIRVNQAKWNGIPSESEIVKWCKNGYYLNVRPSYTLDPLFHSGCYYPQEASSMFLGEVISQTSDLNGSLRVLDLCAAPGGKSTHLSDIIGSESLLVANDAIRSRAAILAETTAKWGNPNTIVTQNDPSLFGRLQGYFDIILVDAPCSGEGMFRSAVALEEWSPGNLSHCSERQKRILNDVFPALKENGILIYSTCTFNPGENEENIKWLIAKGEAECIKLDLSRFNEITEIDFEGVYGYGFFPYKVKGEGYFISAVRKKAKQERIHLRYQTKTDQHPHKKEIDVLEKWTTFSKDRTLKWGSELIAIPCNRDEFLQVFTKFKIVKAGTKVFTVKNNNYLPSHELALSQKIVKDAFPKIDVDHSVALSFLRRDIFSIKSEMKSWYILAFNNVNLGFVKNIGSRLNNYFPVDWRIRMNLPEPGSENIVRWK